jgi:nicotinate-nucleotide--dimethylbenzimidazole phosphoribosyltransferase
MSFLPSGIAPLTHTSIDAKFAQKLQHKIDQKTKPQGALGQLEALALRLGCIQRSDVIVFEAPQIIVFAADHGITEEGVSAYPQAVTQHMVANMLSGGAAVNVFARQHGFALTVVDAGVAAELPAHPQLLKRKMGLGTRNICWTTAMSTQQGTHAVNAGMETVRSLPGNVVALGEMGIGNTSSAALIFALLSKVTLQEAAGRGTGLNDAQMQTKLKALNKALVRHAALHEPLDVLCAVGGFEIAMMVGAMLEAAHQRRVVLVDGFIAGAAALVACAMEPHAFDYMVFCHVGAEQGHRALLARMGATPLLDLGMRLGEGSGALLAWPLVQSAARFVNEMASFESAGVAQRT